MLVRSPRHLSFCARIGSRTCFFVLLGALAFAAHAAAPPPGGSLEVAVRNASTHDPLRGVYIGLIAMDQPAHRPAMEAIVDGNVRWQGIPAGRYALVAEGPAFGPVMRTIEIGEARNDQATVDLEHEIEITGVVVDATGHPIEGATISDPRIVPPTDLGVLSDLARKNATQLRTKTDKEGRWKFTVPLGGIPLLVEAPGYEAAWIVRDTTPGQPPIALHAGSSLRVVTNRPAPVVHDLRQLLARLQLLPWLRRLRLEQLRLLGVYLQLSASAARVAEPASATLVCSRAGRA